MRGLYPWIASAALGCCIGVAAAAVAWNDRHRAELLGPAGPPPRAGAARAVSIDRPNVVLIIGSSVRRDQVEPYGGLSGTTPFLAELAASGVRFSDAVSAAPWSRGAAAAVTSGHPFRGVGMSQPKGMANHRKLAPAVTTLAEVFAAAGYWTIGATASPDLNGSFGFGQGFDRYRDVVHFWQPGMTFVPGSMVVDRALRDVDRRKERNAPVFLQILLTDARNPARGSDDTAPGSVADDAPPRVQRYRAQLRRFDSAVKRLANGLSVRGYDLENTLFVVVSDHGEGLSWPAEQGVGHGNYLVPSVLEMTWLMRGGAVGGGVVVEGVTSQIDVFPTIAGLAGVPGYVGPGADWSALVGAGGRADRGRAFADTDFERSDKSMVFSDTRACEIQRRAQTVAERCFDRVADPGHRAPLPANDEALLAELVAWRSVQADAALAWPDTSDAVFDDYERRVLVALGALKDGP